MRPRQHLWWNGERLSMSNNHDGANSAPPKDTGITVRAVMSVGKVISQLLSRGSFESVPVPRCLWLTHVAL